MHHPELRSPRAMILFPDKVLILYLALMLSGTARGGENHQDGLRRHKRHWVVPPLRLKENHDYRDTYVAKIRSDKDEEGTMFYTLLGHGASMEPHKLFVVEETTGLVRVFGVLDREERDCYVLTGMARFSNGTVAEPRIDLTIEVEDENDNPPVFAPFPGAQVNESSPAGTLVAQVNATDADEINTLNSKIAYSIIKQEPVDGSYQFYIEPDTGSIFVKEETLDRERVSFYSLTIEGADMDGTPGGNTATTVVDIQVKDINDNTPTLEKDEFSCSIVENVAKVEVLRLRALDPDEENTDNWLAVFDIIAGNEDNLFSIETDPETNEGILLLEKPLDFEEAPDIKLAVIVSNKASPAEGAGGDAAAGGLGGAGGAVEGQGAGGGKGEGGAEGEAGGGGLAGNSAGAKDEGGGSLEVGVTAGGDVEGVVGAGASIGNIVPVKKNTPGVQSYQVNIKVEDEQEGAAFKPKVKHLQVSENPDSDLLLEVIGIYQATDEDSGKPAQNVKYAKGEDKDNWLSVNPETAEISLNKVPDRESPFLLNGTYYATILCLSQGIPSKTATGTIAIQVADTNDNCPILTSNLAYICSNTQLVMVSATDHDAEPNGAPFLFSLVPEETKGLWSLEPHSDTSAALTPLESLWPGRYTVGLDIQDQQGKSCPTAQLLDLNVCSCVEGTLCREATEHRAALGEQSLLFGFGPACILALFLGVLILFVVGLTAFACWSVAPTTFTELPYDTKEHLIAYHTEGQGEDRGVPTLIPPYLTKSARPLVCMDRNQTSNMTVNMAIAKQKLTNSMTYAYGSRSLGNWKKGDKKESHMWDMNSIAEEEKTFCDEGLALSNTFLNSYYSQRGSHLPDTHLANDMPLVYEYDGKGSSAGSLGCCSLLESDNDQQFLDDLDMKFRTLAQVCLPELFPPNPHPAINKHNPMQLKAEQVARPVVKEPNPVCINNGAVTKSNNSNTNTNSRQSSTVNSGYFTTSSTVKSTISNNSQQGSRSILATVAMAVSPSAYQQVVLQQQPFFYQTASIPVACIIQPQLQCTALLAGVPADAGLPSVALFHEKPQQVLVSGGGQAGCVFTLPRATERKRDWPKGRSSSQDMRTSGL